MAGRRNKRFTIYDMMEERGVFEANPANADSRGQDGLPLYKGPVEFPRMVYHPTGEQRISVPAEIIMTPMGPRKVGEQKQLIDKVVSNQIELDEALANGWHKTPAAAVAIRNGETPVKTQSETIEDLEARIRELQLEKSTREAEELGEAKLMEAASKGAVVKTKPVTVA